MSTKKRLTELGIAQPEDELEILRDENSSLKIELEKKKIELDVIKSNFQETLQKIIESARAVNYDITFDPLPLQPPEEPPIYLRNTGNATGIQSSGGSSGDGAIYDNGNSSNLITVDNNNNVVCGMAFTNNTNDFCCGDVSFLDREL